MKKNFCIIFILLLIFVNVLNSDNSDSIDLSDKNPLVYCLKNVKKYDFEEIKNFILQNQDPEFAIEYYPNDEEFNFCIEQRLKNGF